MRRLLCFQLLGTLSQVSSYCLQLDDQLLPSSLCIHQDSLTLNTYSKRTTPLERLALLIFPPLAHGHSMPAAAPSLINWSHFSRLISATTGVQGASPLAGSRGSALAGSWGSAPRRQGQISTSEAIQNTIFAIFFSFHTLSTNRLHFTAFHVFPFRLVSSVTHSEHT